MDQLDRRLLAALQRDAGASIEALGEAVGLSRNACWRRIRRLEQDGVIVRRVALLDPARVNLALTVFIAIRTDAHDPDWLERFARAVAELPEIQGVYRTSGELDYLIRARVPDVAAYDALYQRLIRKVRLSDVSASFVMEEIKETTELCPDYVRTG